MVRRTADIRLESGAIKPVRVNHPAEKTCFESKTKLAASLKLYRNLGLKGQFLKKQNKHSRNLGKILL
jgi:hypothetical protein